uniref:Tail tubular protein B n=1 Tax=uncultured Alphaproteobacteria bacterium TaxID=91750 RepID=A0A1B0Z1I8_9PROT|nr:tail tubular protein B [uncultured Alphaproteobacteria bacterium]
MPLVSRNISNLIGGVSQQPEVLRLENQATLQDNGFSGVVEGLKKRPPTNYVAKISSSSLSNAFIHTINRDASERYIVVITNGAIAVYTIDGTQKTVVAQTNATNYLASSTPRSEFKCLTVNDYTYIVNTNKTVAMDATTSTGKVEQAIYQVTQGINSTKYSITIDATTYDFTSSNSDTEAIRDGLFSAVGSPAGITVTKIGNSSFKVVKASGTLSVSASDGYGDNASQIIYDSAQNFSDLPAEGIDGQVVEIKGDAANNFDNYWVKWVASTSVWEETIAPSITYKFDYDTMPHLLIRTADGNFRLTQADGSTYTVSSTDYTVPQWGERQVGDLNSAPNPSFVDTKIKDIFFHSNRLGVLADENVILSRSSEYFEFFAETVTDVLDTDVIDINVSHTKVSLLKNAIPFNTNLLIFSDQTQFLLSGGTSLTPSNVAVDVATEYEALDSVKPVGSGSNVFFGFNKGEFTGLREYYVESDGETNEGEDITANIPKYIPSNVFKFAIASNENVLVALSSKASDINKLYVYQWFYADNKRLQSAWHSWSFGTTSNVTILNVDFIGTTLYLLMQRSDGVYIETIDVAPATVDTSANYLTHLDRKITNTTTGVSESYNAGTNQTTITIPYTIDNTMKLVGASTAANTAGTNITLVSAAGTSIVVAGDITAYDFFMGENYTFTYTFSQQYMALGDQYAEGSRTRIKDGRLQIRNWTVSYNDTSYFQAIVTPAARDASTTTFTGTVVGSGLAGRVNLEDGDYEFAVLSRNEGLTVSLTNDSHLPSNFVNAEWQGYYTKPA